MSSRYTFIECDEDGVWYCVPLGLQDMFWLAYDRMTDDNDYTLWDKYKFSSMRCLHPQYYSFEDVKEI